MKSKILRRHKDKKILIRLCHHCGHLSESSSELAKCQNTSCGISFLPSAYFGIYRPSLGADQQSLLLSSEEINEDDLIKGIQVLW